MADPLFFGELDEITEFTDGDYGVNESTPAGTPETNYIKRSNELAEWLRRTHYQISRTVSSNNLILALKNPDGQDATADRGISFDINGTIRKLTGALSLQINAGVNTFNLGSTELANLVQQLFVYVGWRASTSSIFLLISRMSYFTQYADASSTATDERYGAYSGAAPAGTDQLKLIGRVTIQNGGSASYNWTVPLLNQVISHPIYETSWLEWNPTLVGFSSNPGGLVNRYRARHQKCEIFVRQASSGTSNNTIFTISLPYTAKTIGNMAWGSSGVVLDNGVAQTTGGALRILSAATIMDVYKDQSQAAFTNSGSKRLANMNPMIYEIGA